MTPEEYAAAQAVIAAGALNYAQRFASLFTGAALSLAEWVKLLQVIFPDIQRRYTESATLGREFYDSQRDSHHPRLERNERFLSELPLKQFIQNMEPARKVLSQADAPRFAPATFAMTAAREVDMAARRQILGAVKNDSAPQIVQGWARVATGRETCAWCLMLISRGAEFPGKSTQFYHSALTAGLGVDDETAIDLFNEAGGDLDAFRAATKDSIEEWHVGCDCLIVPVFDIRDWPGRDKALEAQDLWIDATKEANALIKSGLSRTTNRNKETLNALRRRLASGDINMSTYALAA